MTIKILGVEINAADIEKLLNTQQEAITPFNKQTIKTNLTECNAQIATLEKSKQPIPHHLVEMHRLFTALDKMRTWTLEYNQSDQFPIDEIVKVKRVVSLNIPPNFRELAKVATPFVYINGLYTILDLYIIPYKFVFPRGKQATTDKQVFNRLREISRCAAIAGYQKTGISLPEDGQYSSSRHISPTHFAVVVTDEQNVFTQHDLPAHNWRFISADGQAI